MSVYELIEHILTDLNKTAASILTTAQNIAVLRDALKAADQAKLEEAEKQKEEKVDA